MLPQLASGLGPKTLPLKMIRIYEIWLLHYPLEALFSVIYPSSDKHKIYVTAYACSTLCRIAMLLHYLAVMWLWIGSPHFTNFETEFMLVENNILPWQAANADFHEYTKTQLYVFSVYWVCTVITCVGYGDYTGKTSLEYCFCFILEFFGIIVFAVLQIAVQQVVKNDPTFTKYINEMDWQITFWLMKLEKSNQRKSIPKELFEAMQLDLWRRFRRDPNLIVTEYDFFKQLTPKIQDQVVKLLFQDTLADFSDFFAGCESQFVNNMIVSMTFRYFTHGQTIQSAKYECQEIYLVKSGGIAVCEPTCFSEPILIYGKGSAVNLYQCLLNCRLEFCYIAVAQESYKVKFNAEGDPCILYD